MHIKCFGDSHDVYSVMGVVGRNETVMEAEPLPSVPMGPVRTLVEQPRRPTPPPQQRYSVPQHGVRVVRVARVFQAWLSMCPRSHTDSFCAFRTLCAS